MEESYDEDEENFEIIEEIELDDEGPNAGITCTVTSTCVWECCNTAIATFER